MNLPIHLISTLKQNAIALSVMTLLFYSCTTKQGAQEIVDKAIKAHGGAIYEDVFIEFDFRDKHYTIKNKNGKYEYTRSFKDATNSIKDVLTNNSFSRHINGRDVVLADSMVQKYSNSVNSVVYFAMTPFVLNDKAVKKKYLGICAVKGKKYHKIQVTFNQESGGEDFDDEFVYWFGKDDYIMDYFAYKFKTDGGGSRYREMYNPRRVGGILFTDHINSKYSSLDTPLAEYDQLCEDTQLSELSRIILKNVKVTSLK